MKKIVKNIFIIFLMSISACGYSQMKDEEFYKNKMIQNMELASVWIVENGIQTFKQKGREGIFKKLLDQWGVQLWVDPWIESESYLARFAIKARGINYEILNLNRIKMPSGFYEFWLIKITGSDWSGEANRSVFYVTRTNNIYGERDILVNSDQFIRSYQVDAKTIIDFPVDDKKILFDMQAWLFPASYESSELKNIEAIMDESGEIVLIHRGS